MKRVAWLVVRQFDHKRSRILVDALPINATDCRASAAEALSIANEERPDLKHSLVRVEYDWPPKAKKGSKRK